MIKNKCKNYKKHTRCPKTYLDWMDWADKMTKNGYRQVVCHTCGRYDIWTNVPIKKKKKVSLPTYNYNVYI